MAVNRNVAREAELAQFLASFYGDPYGFVMAVFPWGEEFAYDENGNQYTNPLANWSGPEDWQRDELIALGEHIKNNVMLTEMGLQMEVYRLAIASGHGVGKSAFL